MHRLASRLVRGVAMITAIVSTGAAAASQSQLWIVSQSGCPSVHFATIQEAIDAAAPGDVILVRPGAYGSFAVSGKSLALVADNSGLTTTGAGSIRNLPNGASVLLQGFDGISGLVVDSNLGHVWVEGCDISSGRPAIAVSNSGAALFSRCTAVGSHGAGVLVPESGGDGVQIDNSTVTFYDSSITGGIGSPASLPGQLGGQGGSGLRMESGAGYFAGGNAIGGRGGTGYGMALFFEPCTSGGGGGLGVFVDVDAQLQMFGTNFRGGFGGTGGQSATRTCSNGPSGNTFTGPLSVLPGNARSFWSSSPVQETDSVAATFRGVPGDTAVLYFSFAQQQVFLPFLGTLAPMLPGATLVAGLVPISFSLSGDYFIPPGLVGPNEALVLYDQGLFLSATQQAIIGSPFAWVILDENHDWSDGC